MGECLPVPTLESNPESTPKEALLATTELTEWRPFSDFAEIRHRLDQAFRTMATWSCAPTFPASSPRR